jgi:hypothetical protein
MKAVDSRIAIGAGLFVLLAATVLAAYFAVPAWLLLPVGLVAIFCLVQYPAALFYLLLATIPWSMEYNFTSGLGTDLPDEPLMLLMAFTTVALLLYHRNAFVTGKSLHPLLVLLALQVIWLLITVILSTYFVLSAKYFLAKTWYVLAFVAAPLLLWKDERVLKRSVVVLFTAMLLVTTLLLIRHAMLGFTFAGINKALAPFFRNHVNYSALLVFMIPLQVMFWQQARTKTLRWLLLLSFLITVPALYLSYARGAWLALLTGMATYWLVRRRWLWQSFLVIIILTITAVLWLRHNDRYLQFAHHYQSTVFHEDFKEHLAATYQLKDVSTAERFHRWIAGLRMTEDSWQAGFGPTTFYRHYKSYTVPAFKTWVSRNEEQSTVHNYFLLLLVEQGAVGLLLFLALLTMLFWYAQRIYHRTDDVFWKRVVATTAVILVMQCTLNFLSDLIETDKVGSVFYLCIAALVIAERAAKNRREHFV